MQRYEIGTKTQLLLKTDMAKMNFTPADDLVDEVWGKIGSRTYAFKKYHKIANH